jgi:pimeloyl-ACP methyl ester carboxylesterase
MSLLSNLVGRVASSRIIRLYSVEWAWPEEGDPPEAWERSTFEGRHGPLVGSFGQAAREARGVVVCAHPITRAAKGYFLTRGHGRFLREAGYHVFLFDFNGFGEGPYQSILYTDDVLAAGFEAQRRAPGLPVGFLGVCFGATYGLCAMAEQSHPYAAAVFETPYTGLAHVLSAMHKHVRRTRIYEKWGFVSRHLAPFFREQNAFHQAPHSRHLRAVLFVAGERDTIVPPESVRAVAEALRRSQAPAAQACEVWTVPDGEHLRVIEADPEEYARRITRFFDASLTAMASASESGTAEIGPRLGDRAGNATVSTPAPSGDGGSRPSSSVLPMPDAQIDRLVQRFKK